MSLKSSIWAGLLLGGLAVNALAQTALKDAYKPFFRIGAALNPGQFNETNALGASLVKTHFDSITPENILKWGLVHPRPDAYAFEASDRFVAGLGCRIARRGASDRCRDRQAVFPRQAPRLHRRAACGGGGVDGGDAASLGIREGACCRAGAGRTTVRAPVPRHARRTGRRGSENGSEP